MQNDPSALKLSLSKQNIENIILLCCFFGMVYALIIIFSPFVGVFSFTLIFAVSFAVPFERLVKFLKYKRRLAAIVYCVFLLLIVAQPFLFLINNLYKHFDEAINLFSANNNQGLPPLHPSIANIPMIGTELENYYNGFRGQPKEIMQEHGAEIKLVLGRVLSKGLGLLTLASEIALSIILSSILLFKRRSSVHLLKETLGHLIGKEDAKELLNTTDSAIKGVSIGIMGTAFIAASFAWVGLLIAHIHFSLAIAAIVFFLVIIQIGPIPVWIPLVAWLFIQGENGWAIFMIIWGVVLLALDAFIKPYLISKSGELPFIILFLGVVGGMMAWGFTGMFKGAILVAIAYTIFKNWLAKKNRKELNVSI